MDIKKLIREVISESKFYIKHTEIPPQIVSWARSVVGKGFEGKIEIVKEPKAHIGMPWHEADREYHQFFKLTEQGAESAGKMVSKSGWSEVNMGDVYGTVDIPSGYILATASTFPKSLKIRVSDDATSLIPDTGNLINQLSDDAVVALYHARSLKSPYRQKFPEEVYQELVGHGLLKPNKAITIDGKNLVEDPKTKERLRSLKDIKVKDRWGYENRKYDNLYNI